MAELLTYFKRITEKAYLFNPVKPLNIDNNRLMCILNNTIHMGLESGSDEVLKMVRKGVKKDVEGKLPDDKPRMIKILRSFLAMTPEDQCVYQVGRRLGIFAGLSDLEKPRRLAKVKGICRDNEITPENVDAVTEELMKKFI